MAITNPTSIANLVFWGDIDQMGLANGAGITSINDFSGNLNHFNNGGGAVVVANALNGHDVARFDGVDDTYFRNLSWPETYTLFAVVKDGGSTAGLILEEDTGSPRIFQYRVNGDFIFFHSGGTAEFANAPHTAGTWQALTARRRAGGGDSYQYDNLGEAVAEGGSNPSIGSTRCYLGSRGNSTNFLNGDLACLVIYSRDLTDAEIADLQKWAIEKYGLSTAPSQPTASISSIDHDSATVNGSAYSDPEGDAHESSQFQVDNNSDFSSPVYDSGVVTARTSQNTGNILSPHTTYYGRVRYKDKYGNWSSWSAGVQFSTLNRAPAQPTCSISNVDTDSATINGSAYSDPDGDAHQSSQFQVWTPGFGTKVYDSGTVTARTSQNTGNVLSPGTDYEGRVRYHDGFDWSAWSAVAPFTTPALIAAGFDEVPVAGFAAALSEGAHFAAGFDEVPVTGFAAELIETAVFAAEFDEVLVTGFDATLQAAEIIEAGFDEIPIAAFEAVLVPAIIITADFDEVPVTGFDAGLDEGVLILAGFDEVPVVGFNAALSGYTVWIQVDRGDGTFAKVARPGGSFSPAARPAGSFSPKPRPGGSFAQAARPGGSFSQEDR